MKFQKRILNNGIIVLHEERNLPLVALSISNKFGAANEEEEIKGVAHFIEHLLFTGTKTRTHEDISREIEKKGGILNAFTSHDVTSYWFKLPSEHLFIGLEILSDMFNNPTFNELKFEKEKKVILEEIKMYHDIPMRFIHDMIEENLYDSPFGKSVIGSAKTVSALKRDFVYSIFQEAYNSKNLIVTIVGQANLDKVCEFLEKNFHSKETKITTPEIKLIHKESVEEREGLDQSHYIFAIHAPLVSEKSHAALEVLNAYLAQGMSSKLFLTIREEKGLAYSVRGYISAEKNYSYYAIYVGTTREALPEVKKLILDGFKSAEDLSEKQLQEAKEQLIGLKRVESEESSGVMSELLFHELEGKAEDYYEHEKRINSVTLEEVRQLAKIDKYSTAAIVPK